MTDPDDEWIARRAAALRFRKEHGFTRGSGNKQKPIHGIATYMRDGCRCDLCKEASRERARAYRQRRKQREAS